MELPGIKKDHKTLSERVKNYLLDSILNQQKYLPGDKITETKIAKELQVSQAPVREAIRDLKMMGFIESEPYKGSHVKQVTAKELLDLYDVRINLETLAVRRALQRITEKEIAYLKSLIDKMAKTSQKNDYVKQTELDGRFHNSIIEFSDNIILVKVWNNLGVEYWTWLGLKFLKDNHKFDFIDQVSRHQEIYSVIKDKDVEKAVLMVKKHFNEVKEMLIEIGDL
ncbi:FCD domain-containing protein [Iocasia frigidifontis]|uniref:FCD domain-containing protein n=1 Tax=Iocasia fonsfrigidae TaxID=2682810 RepID=A0A8A7KNB7_9FIRM|nr:GntR family transcriptional regulator [Iocasia fonsfrigidae]QTL99342.1 FCD domain-containing protein [Iocasia fonsfrigidae]